MAYPCHYADMVNLFGRGPPQLSMIFNQTVDSIDANCEKLINAGCLALVYKLFLTLYTEKEQLLEICGISSMLQIVLFADRKFNKVFCTNVFMLWNFIANLCSPVERRRHDCSLLTRLNLLQIVLHFSNAFWHENEAFL